MKVVNPATVISPLICVLYESKSQTEQYQSRIYSMSVYLSIQCISELYILVAYV